MLAVLAVALSLVTSGAPQDGSWRTLAPMPTARQEVAVAALQGKVYVIGGYDATGTPSDLVEVYDFN